MMITLQLPLINGSVHYDKPGYTRGGVSRRPELYRYTVVCPLALSGKVDFVYRHDSGVFVAQKWCVQINAERRPNKQRSNFCDIVVIQRLCLLAF